MKHEKEMATMDRQHKKEGVAAAKKHNNEMAAKDKQYEKEHAAAAKKHSREVAALTKELEVSAHGCIFSFTYILLTFSLSENTSHL
jgi:hypothetical protein